MNDAQVITAMQIDDSYQVVETLARGPSGHTELVMHGEVGPFVRKRIPSALANRAAWGVAMGVEYSRVPAVMAMHELPDELVVVSEYVKGESLESRLARGLLSAGEAVRIATEVCEAVSALHDVHVIHRDITPGNVILSSDGAHLIDLGIARLSTQTPVEGASDIRDTTALGTYGFAAPEQYGFASTDERSDVYSVGKLLQFMLTGSADGNLDDRKDAPARLVRVVHTATQFEPSKRFATAEALESALMAVSESPRAQEVEAMLCEGKTVRTASSSHARLLTAVMASLRRLASIPPLPEEGLPVRESVAVGAAWMGSSVWERLLGASAVLASCLVGVLAAWSSFQGDRGSDGSQVVVARALGLAACVFLVVVGLDALDAAIAARKYSRDGRRLRRWLVSSAFYLVIVLAAALLASVIAAVVLSVT